MSKVSEHLSFATSAATGGGVESIPTARHRELSLAGKVVIITGKNMFIDS